MFFLTVFCCVTPVVSFVSIWLIVYICTWISKNHIFDCVSNLFLVCIEFVLFVHILRCYTNVIKCKITKCKQTFMRTFIWYLFYWRRLPSGIWIYMDKRCCCTWFALPLPNCIFIFPSHWSYRETWSYREWPYREEKL